MTGTVLDLREVDALAPLLPHDLDLSDEDRRHAVHEWRGRMVSEHASARVFAALFDQAMRAGVTPGWLDELSAMVQEELQHARLCARAVASLGAVAVAPMPPLPRVPEHAAVPPLEGLVRNVLSICCLEETVAVALLEANRARVAYPALADAVEIILADEVGHARFGWTFVEDALPRLPDESRARLDAYLPHAFRHLVERFGHHAPSSSAAAMAVGACAGPADHDLFARTVEEAIVPALERLGLRGESALVM